MTATRILLLAYPAWVVLLVALTVWTRRRHRRARTRTTATPGSLDLFDTAFLAGGPRRTVETALLVLRAHGSVIISREGNVSSTGRGHDHPVAAGVLGFVTGEGGATTVADLRTGAVGAPAVQAAGPRLTEAGLLRPVGKDPAPAGSCLLALLAALTIVAQWVSLGIPPLSDLPASHPGEFVGSMLERVFGMLVLILTLMGLGSWTPAGVRTAAGDAYVRDLRKDTALLAAVALAVPGGEGLGPVALDGMFRLDKGPLRDVLYTPARPTAAGATSSSPTDDVWSMRFAAVHDGSTSSSHGGSSHHHSSHDSSSPSHSCGGGHHHSCGSSSSSSSCGSSCSSSHHH